MPQQTDLLWVYEGMNEYLGDLLSFRAGIRDYKDYPEYLASIYAEMDTETGRDTTPIIDLTAGAPYFFVARGDYHAIRRNANDFYTEGELLWLDVDTIIREQSHEAKLARHVLAQVHRAVGDGADPEDLRSRGDRSDA